MIYHRMLNIVHCAIYHRIFLFIHPMYNSLHLLIPDSQSFPPPLCLTLGNHKSVLFIYEFTILIMLGTVVNILWINYLI